MATAEQVDDVDAEVGKGHCRVGRLESVSVRQALAVDDDDEMLARVGVATTGPGTLLESAADLIGKQVGHRSDGRGDKPRRDVPVELEGALGVREPLHSVPGLAELLGPYDGESHVRRRVERDELEHRRHGELSGGVPVTEDAEHSEVTQVDGHRLVVEQ